MYSGLLRVHSMPPDSSQKETALSKAQSRLLFVHTSTWKKI